MRRFEQVVCPIFESYTTAPTMGKALSNIAYKYKEENGLAPTAKVELDKLFLDLEEI